MTHDQQKAAICMLLEMFVDAIKVAGDRGAPGGVLYSAVLGKMTLAQFEQIMDALVQSGKVTRRGQLYFAVQS